MAVAPGNRATIQLLVQGTVAMAVVPLSALFAVQGLLESRGVEQRWCDICAVAAGVLCVQLVVAWFAYAAWSLDAQADEAQPQVQPQPAAKLATIDVKPMASGVALPECVLPTLSPRMIRQRSALSARQLEAASSPASSPATSPQSPAPKDRKGLTRRLSSFSLRARADSGSARTRGDSALSPLSRRKIVVPVDADTMDVALRVSVAPWLVQDEALATKRLSGFVDGCEVDVASGAVVDHEGDDLGLRAQVAPWTVQLANVSDGEHSDDGQVDDAAAARSRSGSLLSRFKLASPQRSASSKTASKSPS